MPIFEYVCEECRQSFEKIVRSEEAVQCPGCQSEHLSKQYSRFGMSGASEKYESLPMYKGGGGGGCCCSPGSCGCKN